MQSGTPDQLIERYLERVRVELDDLPADEREEIIDGLQSHIEEAAGSDGTATEADVRNVLDRLGHPQDVAREARTRSHEQTVTTAQPVRYEPHRTPGALEVAAIILTALFWPIGVLLAWISGRWKTRDKVVATVVPALTTFMLVLIVLGGLVVWGSTSETVTVVADQVEQVDPDAGSVPPPEPRTPEFTDSMGDGGVLARFVVIFGFIGGVIGGPFFAAVYLAIRLQPGERRGLQTSDGTHRGVPAGGQV